MKTVVFALFMLTSMLSLGQVVICRSTRLDGFEKEMEYANKILGNPTSNVDSLKVFITVSKSYLFVQSNLKSEGYESTCKLVVDEIMELEDIVLNLICIDFDCPYKNRIIKILETTRFYVDKVAVNQSIYSKLDFTIMKHVSYPQPNTIDSFQISSDHSQEKIKVNTSQNDKIIIFDDGKTNETPKDFTSATIDLFYHSTLGKILLVFILIFTSIFIVWKSLPEDAKSKILKCILEKIKKK